MQAITTDKAPAAIGPYSQATVAGGILFCSGQIPLDPNTGALVSGTIELETTRVMENLRGVLEAAGTDFDHVVKTTIYLTNISDFPAVNQVYGRYFSNTPPARATIAVAGLPKGARVEIEAIAVL